MVAWTESAEELMFKTHCICASHTHPSNLHLLQCMHSLRCGTCACDCWCLAGCMGIENTVAWKQQPQQQASPHGPSSTAQQPATAGEGLTAAHGSSSSAQEPSSQQHSTEPEQEEEVMPLGERMDFLSMLFSSQPVGRVMHALNQLLVGRRTGQRHESMTHEQQAGLPAWPLRIAARPAPPPPPPPLLCSALCLQKPAELWLPSSSLHPVKSLREPEC